jgi:hypothetical protein
MNEYSVTAAAEQAHAADAARGERDRGDFAC